MTDKGFSDLSLLLNFSYMKETLWFFKQTSETNSKLKILLIEWVIRWSWRQWVWSGALPASHETSISDPNWSKIASFELNLVLGCSNLRQPACVNIIQMVQDNLRGKYSRQVQIYTYPAWVTLVQSAWGFSIQARKD